MNGQSAEAWLTQEIEDLLDVGSVGLYEFMWMLNDDAFGFSRAEAIELSRRVATGLVSSGAALIYTMRWPNYEPLDGPLPPQVLDEDSAWDDIGDDPYLALIPPATTADQTRDEGDGRGGGDGRSLCG